MNKNGFALIYALIVIAIIIIMLLIITAPNHIAYRKQSICAATDQVACRLLLTFLSYFDSPTNTTLTSLTPA